MKNIFKVLAAGVFVSIGYGVLFCIALAIFYNSILFKEEQLPAIIFICIIIAAITIIAVVIAANTIINTIRFKEE